jgi:hypothetical protein
MSHSDSSDPASAALALAATNAARSRMAAGDLGTRWYAPLYGTGVGALIASYSLPQHLILLGVGVSMLGIALLFQRWKQRTGLSVNGYRPGRTRPTVIAFAVLMIGLLIAGVVLRFRLGINWAPLALGVVGGIVAALASRRFDRIWREELAAPL